MTAPGGSGSMVDRENMVIQGHGQPGHLVHKVRDVKAGVDFFIKGRGHWADVILTRGKGSKRALSKVYKYYTISHNMPAVPSWIDG